MNNFCMLTMKKITIIVLLVMFPYFVKSQIILKGQTDSSTSLFLSPMMKDYLLLYQQKNTLKKVPDKPIGISEVKKSVESHTNLVILKPDLVQITKMPFDTTQSDTLQHLLIVAPKK